MLKQRTEMLGNSPARPPWGRVPYGIEDRRPWSRMPFDAQEYRSRWERVAERLRTEGFDAIAVFATPGQSHFVRYLTNFDSMVGHSIAVIFSDGQCSMITNSTFRDEPMHTQIWTSPVEELRITSSPGNAKHARCLGEILNELLVDHRATKRVAIAGPFTHTAYRSLCKALPQTDFLDSHLLYDIMAIKTLAEIELTRKAMAVVDRTFERVKAMIEPGVSENQIAGAVFAEMGNAGCEGFSFPLALVGGPRSGHKHVAATEYKLRKGDLFFMDLGILLDGYATDNSRGGAVGKIDADARRFLEAGEAMTLAAISAAGPGVPHQRLDDAAFEVAKEYGFVDDYYFRAHGIGTSAFLPPLFFPGDETPLRPGEIFVVEPMLVREGYGTACDEFTVLVKEEGVEVLSTAGSRWW